MAREILLIFGWLFPSLRLLLKYLIFICNFISDPAEKNCPKWTVFMLAESSPRAWLYRKNLQTIKASWAKNWGAGICCVTSLPRPFSSSSSFLAFNFPSRSPRSSLFPPLIWSQAIERSWRNSHDQLRLISTQVARIWYSCGPKANLWAGQESTGGPGN